MNMTEFLGQTCIEIAQANLSLLACTSVGPRVLALRVNGEQNIFAELPDFTLENPNGETFHLYGGHRLWYAPEIPEVTYLPDDQPVAIVEDRDAIRMTQPKEKGSGIQKEISLQFLTDGAVRVGHTLKNLGDKNVVCAPWAITMLKPGGVAILPQPRRIPGTTDKQPNRALVLWPYTNLSDDLIDWGNDFVLVTAQRKRDAVKVGCPNPDGWMAYFWEGVLFVKFARYTPAALYYDLNASSQCYCNDQFLELESLGRKTVLRPGESVDHLEVWKVYENIQYSATQAGTARLAKDLRLNQIAASYTGIAP